MESAVMGEIIDNAPPKVDFYFFPPSAPCRAVMIVAKLVGVDLNLKIFNMLENEHKKPKYTTINPQYTLPAINDNGLFIFESHPILTYLISQYGDDDSWYPMDPQKRLIVDNRLYFDHSTLYSRIADYFHPQPSEYKRWLVEEALDTLESFLAENEWVAGDTITVADIAIVCTVSTIQGVGFDIDHYPNIRTWFTQAKEVLVEYGYSDLSEDGARACRVLFQRRIK